MHINVFICNGYCMDKMLEPLEEGDTPTRVAGFDGTWLEAKKLGWRLSTNIRFSRAGQAVFLCPDCVKRAIEEGVLQNGI